jgi:PRC-barrel domain
MVADERETGTLIGSDKVEGTAVYGPDDQEIGTIERVMIDKLNGKLSYAVLTFGGFLSIGDDHYPLPWQSLKYDTNLGGYRTCITLDQLKGAPKYANDDAFNWGDATRTRAVNEYCGVPLVAWRRRRTPPLHRDPRSKRAGIFLAAPGTRLATAPALKFTFEHFSGTEWHLARKADA